VLLVNAPNKSTDSISLTGSGCMTLSPSSSLTGAYAAYDGITILQNPASTVPIIISGSGGLTISGVLCAPKALLDITGTGGLMVNPDPTYGRAEVIVSDLKDAGRGSVTINVDRPTVTIGSPLCTSVPGEPVPLVIQVCDASSLAEAAAFTFTISFGDGDSTTLSSKAPLVVNHVYTKTGTYTVSVTTTDKSGYPSLPATVTIKVVAVAVETDPFNSKLTALFVGGTSGNDTVKFAASGKSGIAVTLNGVSEGTYATSGPLIVFGQGGNDTIDEGSGLKNPVDLLQSPTANNLETDLDDEALQWAGLSAAVEILIA
jgi:PKD domain